MRCHHSFYQIFKYLCESDSRIKMDSTQYEACESSALMELSYEKIKSKTLLILVLATFHFF